LVRNAGKASFELVSPYEPAGDQPKAIRELTERILSGEKHSVLLGVTGSGKTFTLANVIRNVGLPALVISHNKTLAAQLYGEFRGFFPGNAVEYFISYYDYYQPEAYMPVTDTYIEKDASINEEIERLRLKATSDLLERDDALVVASVSCIYGLGAPGDYKELVLEIGRGERSERDDILEALVAMQYSRNDYDLRVGTFRVRGDVVEIFPAYRESVVRVELDEDLVERISSVDPLTGSVLAEQQRAVIYPARHYVTTYPRLEQAVVAIQAELDERLAHFEREGKLLEAQRLQSRTKYDLEMLREVGFCTGIENYSRHLSGRGPGERPGCLLDYYQGPFLTIIDESHVTLPQLRGMYRGDRSRKQTLVEHGFRLPSALDNRPLYFEEFMEVVGQVIYVSATPGEWEIEAAGGHIIEQVIRPTGLVDPKITLRPITGQVDHLLGEIRTRVQRQERVLVTTLTKRMAEDLADYLQSLGIRVRYLHSEIGALERVEILRGLRLAEFDVVVGINLLREGLDLPEVSLVAILDADKEGFLRSTRSLIQTAGRAARNVQGEVLMYADEITDSMRQAIDETNRRRVLQIEYNEKHGISPKTIVKSVEQVLGTTAIADEDKRKEKVRERKAAYLAGMDAKQMLAELRREMNDAAKRLEFELAATLRDKIEEIELQERLAGPRRSRPTRR
jgi:excinuclease ABC subunit B